MSRLFSSLIILVLISLTAPLISARSAVQDSINLADWTVRVPTDVQPGQLNYFNFTRPEGVREFWLYVPSSYDFTQSWPFTFFFHGYSANYRQGISLNMTADAEAASYLIAFGQGTPSTQNNALAWNGGVCCKFPNATSPIVDDVMFTRIALKIVQNAVNVDETRVYAAGWSNGGFMVERLACEASDIFAGICADESAVGIEPGGQQGLAKCDKSFGDSHLNYLHFHGTADTSIPWTGFTNPNNKGMNSISTLEDIARWTQRLGCSGKLMQTYNDGTFSNLVWPECRGNSTIELMSVRNGVHQWWTKNQGNFATMKYVMAFFDRTHQNSLEKKKSLPTSSSSQSNVAKLMKKISSGG